MTQPVTDSSADPHPGGPTVPEAEEEGSTGPLWYAGVALVLAGLACYLAFGDLWSQLEDQSGSRRGGIIRLLMSFGKTGLTIALGVASGLFAVAAVVVRVRARRP